MRLVTFQTRDILNAIAYEGKAGEEGLTFKTYGSYFFNAKLHSMSLKTIYYLASHFMGGLGFSERDILELEVPDKEILDVKITSSSKEYEIPYIQGDWLVSALQFEDWITECAHGENALLYKNMVYRDDTYRMCYSKDIILSGHGYGDDVNLCMSPELLQGIDDSSIQADYVTPHEWAAFKLYCYMLRHDLSINDLKDVKKRDATIEMQDKFNKALIKSFNDCKSRIYDILGFETPKIIDHYYDRLPGYKKKGTTLSALDKMAGDALK